MVNQAEFYNLPKLRRKWEERLASFVTPENAGVYYGFALENGYSVLLRKALEFFGLRQYASNLREFYVTDNFFEQEIKSFKQLKVERLNLSSCDPITCHLKKLSTIFPDVEQMTLPLIPCIKSINAKHLNYFSKLKSISLNLESLVGKSNRSHYSAYAKSLSSTLGKKDLNDALKKYRVSIVGTPPHPAFWHGSTLVNISRSIPDVDHISGLVGKGIFELQRFPRLKSLTVIGAVFDKLELPPYPELTHIKVISKIVCRDAFLKFIQNNIKIEVFEWESPNKLPFQDLPFENGMPLWVTIQRSISYDFSFLTRMPALKKIMLSDPTPDEIKQLLELIPICPSLQMIELKVNDIPDSLYELLLQAPRGVRISLKNSHPKIIKTVKEWHRSPALSLEQYIKVKQTLVNNKSTS
jgi:hypothetical protein